MQKGHGDKLAQVNEVRSALSESASKSMELLSRYAEFKSEYEHERHHLEHRHAEMKLEVAQATAKLLESEQRNATLEEEVRQLGEDAYLLQSRMAEYSESILERVHQLASEPLRLPEAEPASKKRLRTVATQTPAVKDRRWLPIGT